MVNSASIVFDKESEYYLLTAMKRTAHITILMILLVFSLPQISEAQRGCCSGHGGVCGCECCDNTPLSEKCLPFFPSCIEDDVPEGIYGVKPYYNSTSREALIQEHLPYGIPGDERILYRTGYITSHSDELRIPNWVCYHLSPEYLKGKEKRKDDFRPDPDLEPGKRAELSDYKGSGYDRGHMAPAADMKRSKIVMSESFLLSNMAPQAPSFNRGIWAKLEEKVRAWAKKKSLNVCTGPIIIDDDGDGVAEYYYIGENQVAIPNSFFKIIVRTNDSNEIETISFILENKGYPANTDLSEFIVSIDEIEELTGLDFLDKLEDNMEDEVESKKAKALWK